MRAQQHQFSWSTNGKERDAQRMWLCLRFWHVGFKAVWSSFILPPRCLAVCVTPCLSCFFALFVLFCLLQNSSVHHIYICMNCQNGAESNVLSIRLANRVYSIVFARCLAVCAAPCFSRSFRVICAVFPVSKQLSTSDIHLHELSKPCWMRCQCASLTVGAYQSKFSGLEKVWMHSNSNLLSAYP